MTLDTSLLPSFINKLTTFNKSNVLKDTFFKPYSSLKDVSQTLGAIIILPPLLLGLALLMLVVSLVTITLTGLFIFSALIRPQYQTTDGLVQNAAKLAMLSLITLALTPLLLIASITSFIAATVSFFTRAAATMIKQIRQCNQPHHFIEIHNLTDWAEFEDLELNNHVRS